VLKPVGLKLWRTARHLAND